MKRSIMILGVTAVATLASAHSDFNFADHSVHFDVPEISSGVGLIDQQKEKQIGEKVYREIQKQLPVMHDPWLQDQYAQIFFRILGQTQMSQPVGLVILKSPQINAFAVPGGLFALNTGLIANAQNIDEVVGVMAHEVAHVTQRHYSRSQEAFKGQGLLALAGIFVGAALATKSNGEAGSALMLGTQAALIDKQLTYSRNQEREADRIGMQYMYAAGYNPQSMADFFETMQRSSVGIGFLPDFWMTHPLTTERMSEARLRANQLPKVTHSLYDPNFQILKWYTAAVSNQATEEQLKTIVKQGNNEAKFGLAAFYLNRGDSQATQNVLDSLPDSLKQHTLFALIQTDVYLDQHKYEQAYAVINTAQKVMPENRALSYKLATVYIQQSKPSQAQQLVQKFINQNPRDIEAWRLMQQAAALQPQTSVNQINALRYRAEVQFWSGNEENAIKSMLHAQRLATTNAALSARIDQRLKEMQADHALNI
ncbi:M48 family metalloprotease [Acinetobacter soli]|nr:M48 family metalloprotease [Acinetobacter soli]